MKEKLYIKDKSHQIFEAINWFNRNNYKNMVIVCPEDFYIDNVKRILETYDIEIIYGNIKNTNPYSIYMISNIDDLIDVGRYPKALTILETDYYESKDSKFLNKLSYIESDVLSIYSVDFQETLIDELIEVEEKTDESYPKEDTNIFDENIRKTFIKTFSWAEEEVVIVSPWINEYAVDKEILSIMEEALNRGVKIYIKYGLKGDYNTGRDK